MSEHYECPRCGKSVSLWEGVTVSGWRSIDDQLKPCSATGLDRDVDWYDAEPDGTVGCAECGWEGNRLRKIVLGIDGQPLPEQIPGQITIDEVRK